MEEKNEFSDILLERESEAKASRFKKLALIIGAFILIFLLVLVVMKMLNQSSTQDDNSRLTIQPKSPIQESSTQQQNDPLFKEVPIIEKDSKKESFEEMVKKLKEKESKRAKEEKAQEVVTTQIPTKIEPKKEAMPTISTKNDAPVKIVKPAPKKIEKVTPKPIKKSIPKIPDPKPSSKGSVAKGVYVQVLATTKTKPETKYLASLKSKGYDYHIYKTTIKGKKYLKILLGPYGSLKNAKDNLPKIQKDINKNAFVFRVK